MVASEFHRVSPAAALWHGYDRASRTELFSTAIFTNAGLVLIDPVPLEPTALDELTGGCSVTAIVVTNANHQRAAVEFARKFRVPVFVHPDAAAGLPDGLFRAVEDEALIFEDLRVCAIEGAASGEIALFSEVGDAWIVGDALIHFDPSGFTFLPAKYCDDHKRMRRSLQRLLNRPATRLFFAHGLPILSKAGERLRALLEDA